MVEGDIAVEPTIAVLLATYEPNEAWLEELLDSLNTQTYPSLRLYVRDDASPTFTLDRLETLLREHITKFSFSIARNEKNLGSNGTFEELVRDCHEEYIVFCDQDDIWLPSKIENTYRLFCESELSPTLVCANVSVIDGDGKETAPRIDKNRRRHVFSRGNGLDKALIYRNFVMGCTLLMERERALSYLPFPDGIVHDHYLAYRAALDGALDYLDEPQMRYRIYGGNQTGVMTGVNSKDDYRKRRIDVFLHRVECFATYASTEEIERARAWGQARLANFNREKGAIRKLWRLRKVSKSVTLFELVALRLPTPLFRWAIRLIQRGKI